MKEFHIEIRLQATRLLYKNLYIILEILYIIHTFGKILFCQGVSYTHISELHDKFNQVVI